MVFYKWAIPGQVFFVIVANDSGRCNSWTLMAVTPLYHHYTT